MTIKNDFREKGLLLTSLWGFDTDGWGCIGFGRESTRDKTADSGKIIVIYVTKSNGPEWLRGKVVGFAELSGQTGHIKDFMLPISWEEKQQDRKISDRWLHGAEMSRAWKVIFSDLKIVDDVFPNTFTNDRAQSIGTHGRDVEEADFINVEELRVREVSVYKQKPLAIESEIFTITEALAKPSRAGPTNKGNYLVDEIDGPKYLYILKLEGSPADWLGKHYSFDYKNKIIVKVGYSNNPERRCYKDIQPSYPFGQFKWHIMFPTESGNPHAPDEDTAKIGEQAMKDFFDTHPEVKSLGGEFYLVPKNLCKPFFDAGLSAITYPKTKK